MNVVLTSNGIPVPFASHGLAEAHLKQLGFVRQAGVWRDNDDHTARLERTFPVGALVVFGELNEE